MIKKSSAKKKSNKKPVKKSSKKTAIKKPLVAKKKQINPSKQPSELIKNSAKKTILDKAADKEIVLVKKNKKTVSKTVKKISSKSPKKNSKETPKKALSVQKIVKKPKKKIPAQPKVKIKLDEPKTSKNKSSKPEATKAKLSLAKTILAKTSRDKSKPELPKKDLEKKSDFPPRFIPAKKVEGHGKSNFKVGDCAIYPSHGIGKIVGIEKTFIMGQDFSCYLMYFEKEKLSIKIPINSAEKIGLRHLISKAQMDEVFVVLRSGVKKLKGMWSRRAQEYETKINSGDVMLLAEVLRDLTRDIEDGERSYSERIIYETAIYRLAGEYSAIYGVSFEEAKEKVITTAKDKLNAEGKIIQKDGFDDFDFEDERSLSNRDELDEEMSDGEDEEGGDEDDDEGDDDDYYEDDDEDEAPKKKSRK